LSKHETSWCPANQLDFATPWRKQRDTRETPLTQSTGAWRDGCAAERRPDDLLGSDADALTRAIAKTIGARSASREDE